MEFISSELQLGAIALCIGILVGILGYRLIGRSTRETEKMVEELDAAKAELSEYRTNVNQHFHQTSELVNELTQNYVKVYQHLAEGAQSLGDNQGFDRLLEHQEGKVAIAVDESVETPADSSDDRVEPVEAAKDFPENPAEEHAAAADSPPAADTAGEKADESVSAETSGPTPKSEGVTESDDAEATDSKATTAKPDKTPEAVLNVDALGEAIDKVGPDDVPKVVTTKPDSEEKAEIRPTTH